VPDAAELIAEGVRCERGGALDRALEAYQAAAASAADPDIRAEALTHLADVFRTRCAWTEGLEASRQAQQIAKTAQLEQRHAQAVVAEANILVCLGDFDTAVPKLEDIVASTADPKLRGIALQNLGSINAQKGRTLAAERAFTESLGNFHRAAYRRGEGIALNNLGRLALDSKDPERARPLLEQAISYAREVEDSDLVAVANLNLAWALCACEGELDRAQDIAMSALGYFSECNNRWREIECLRLIGEINERCEDMVNARRCYELALNLAEQIGSEHEVRATRDRLSALAR
jgi:tetratricopeptide (TPR) repeat protein